MPVGSPTYLDYQALADDNSAAPPLGAPEGNFQGRHVNDIARHMMAVIRRLGDAALLTTGVNVATADISFGDFRLLNVKASTNRTSAATTGQLQDNTFNWGGSTSGSGAAYTVTLLPLYTGSFYQTGQQVRCLLHTANTVTNPTLNAGAPGPKTIVHRNGAALKVGDLDGFHTRHTFEFDGTNWRALNAGGYMEQATYDMIYPVGALLHKRANEAAPVIPAGVSAVWFRHTHEGFLRAKAAGVPSFGNGTGYVTDSQGNHAHNFSGTTGGDSAPVTKESGGEVAVAQSGHTHAFSGTTDIQGAHQHNYVPPFLEAVVWERSS